MSEPSADFLLILGCRVKGETAEVTLQMRIQRAAAYMREHADTTAIACGGIVHDGQRVSEAAVIKRELENLGIASSRIILEDKSQTTAENFLNAAKILSGKAGSFALLTSDFHVRRAKIIAHRCGFKAIAVVSAPSPPDKLIKNRLRELIVFPGVLLMRRHR